MSVEKLSSPPPKLPEMSSSLRLGQLCNISSTWLSSNVSLLPEMLSLLRSGPSKGQAAVRVSPERLVQPKLSSVRRVQPLKMLERKVFLTVRVGNGELTW